MFVIKRNGQKERLQFDKITARLDALMWDIDSKCVFTELIAQKAITGIFNGIKTSEIDVLTAEIAAYMTPQHPDYATLAARILVSNLHKETSTCFSEAMEDINASPQAYNESTPWFSTEFMAKVRKYAKVLDAAIDHSLDFGFDYFGIKTLLKTYLCTDGHGKIIERPQYMLMRIALALNLDSLPNALVTYKALCEKKYTHATPTLFFAGKHEGQLCSCYLTQIADDSLKSIYYTLCKCADISKESGGIGVAVHKIRAKGSLIKRSRGTSNGLIPMLRNYNSTAYYVDQCFEPSTIVYTKAGPTEIGKVAPTDELVTVDGTFSPVAKILHSHYKGTMIGIKTHYSTQSVRLTPQHPLLVLKSQDAKEPEFVEADKIIVGDYVGYPVPTFEQDIADYTLDDCRMWGIMIGAGWIHESNHSMSVSLQSEDSQEFVQDYLRKFLVEVTSDLKWIAPPRFKITRQLLYDENGNKKLTPHLLHLPHAKILALLKGILETLNDFTLLVNCDILPINSRNLLECLKYVLLRIKIPTWQFPHDTSYALCIPIGQISWSNGFQRDSVLYSRVEKIETLEYDGEVVDLEMTGDNHNYLTQIGLAHNGGGKRKGGFAIYLEPWHADIFDFLDMRKNTGTEHERCRDLYSALWIPDLFMHRVEEDGKWSLFSQDTAPGLWDVYGKEFDQLYQEYEQKGLARQVIPARKVWDAILESHEQTGTPYMVFKDACNQKSNQKNLGTIQSSNLCVHGDTPLLTRDGIYPIATLQNQQVDVWNGEEWSSVVVKQTSSNSTMCKIEFSDNASLVCTPEHRFYIQGQEQYVCAKDLRGGEKLILLDLPDVKTFDHKVPHFVAAYNHGVYCSDASIVYWTGEYGTTLEIKNNRVGNIDDTSDLHLRYLVPTNYSATSKLEWFAGLTDASGSCVDGELHIHHNNLQFLQSLRLMLLTLGVRSNIKVNQKDWSFYRDVLLLCITSRNVQKLVQMGFSPRIVSIPDVKESKDDIPIIVTSITMNYTEGPTYCFTEPKRGMAVFNGYLTGQCAEIVEYTSEKECACCNLGSLNYSAFVKNTESKDGQAYFDFDDLHRVAYLATINLNRVIDVTWYPLQEAKYSNLRHRPLALGDMGLADAFQKLGLPFASDKAKQLNRDIAETVYHACLTASSDLAIKDGPYETFAGSPLSQGIFQFDMWGVKPSGRYDWETLRDKIKKTGVRNSLLRACMPTATTSQILGSNEADEPYTSNLYVRRTLSGEFIVTNKNLVKDLQSRGLWTDQVIRRLIAERGSVQNIDEIPPDLKELYKTVWEIPLKDQIDMCRDRGAYICQSQSFNVHMANPTREKMTKMLFYGWKQGLKTGMYYFRTTPATEAIQFTVDREFKIAKTDTKSDKYVPALETVEDEKERNAPDVCTRESGCTSCQ